MTLREILDTIALRYPHSLTDEQIVSMLNEIQKRLFRTLYKPETATTYDVQTDNAFYPINFSPENIVSVIVDGKEYPYQNIKYDHQPYYYYIVDGDAIGLYPTPTKKVTGGLTVFHYKEPAPLSDVGKAPEFDSGWHMLLVLSACMELTQMNRDIEMMKLFSSQYNRLESEYRRSKRARPHKIKDVYGGAG